MLTGYSLGTIFKAALIAALAASLSAALFHAVATEPVMDRAIAIEEEHAAAAGEHEEPMVSRRAQKVGLFAGFVLYGLVWALLTTVVYRAGQGWLPGAGSRWQRVLLVTAGYWSLALFPFLKYPANPPGVGDPDTIGYRQGLYLLALVLATAGTALSLALARRLSGSGIRAWGVPAGCLAVYSAVVFLALPGNPDEVGMPMDLVSLFRGLSLAGLTLFWGIFAALFALLLRPGRMVAAERLAQVRLG
ncbi:MAG: CbtA family protein [Chloroflexota bacterium]